MDESNAPRNARSPRANVLLAATIEVSGASIAVKLRNLSEQGALIQGERLPVEGSEVLFRRNDLSVAGRIAWVDGQYAGVAFAAPLHPQDVLRNIPQPKPRVHNDYRRPALNPRALTAQEQQLLDSWMGAPTPKLP
ncbi:MAG: PilZ domain-containing protein [Sphingomicrobium sp.]